MSIQRQTQAARFANGGRNNSASRFRRALPAVAVAALIALITAGLWPKPVPVETTRVLTGPLQASVNEEGKMRIRQRYRVAAPIAGLLRRIPFKAGASVEEGTLVAVLDPLPPELLDARRLQLAEARRETARANAAKTATSHRFASSEARRAVKLHADKTISPQQLEEAEWREATAAKELAAAESALREAEAELAQFSQQAPASAAREPMEIKAPISGRVLHVFEESSRPVAAGTPLMELGDPADMEVLVEVLSRDGAAIAPGARMWLEHWGGAKPLEARVRFVEPAAFTKISALGVEEQRVNVVADMVSPAEEWRNLGDQFRVEARIVVWETQSTLKVPTGALFRRGDGWESFAVVNGRAEARSVRIGKASDREVEILGGLREGEELVIYPGDRVQSGLRLRPLRIGR